MQINACPGGWCGMVNWWVMGFSNVLAGQKLGVWFLIMACREPCSTCQILNKSKIIAIIIQTDLHRGDESLPSDLQILL